MFFNITISNKNKLVKKLVQVYPSLSWLGMNHPSPSIMFWFKWVFSNDRTSIESLKSVMHVKDINTLCHVLYHTIPSIICVCLCQTFLKCFSELTQTETQTILNQIVGYLKRANRAFSWIIPSYTYPMTPGGDFWTSLLLDIVFYTGFTFCGVLHRLQMDNCG